MDTLGDSGTWILLMVAKNSLGKGPRSVETAYHDEDDRVEVLSGVLLGVRASGKGNP